MKKVTTNPAQQLFVIPCGDFFTCFGFKNAERDTKQIAEALERADLMPNAAHFGTIEGYDLYRTAVAAWGNSVNSKQTWFSPGTDAKVMSVLEKARKSETCIRYILGDVETGVD